MGSADVVRLAHVHHLVTIAMLAQQIYVLHQLEDVTQLPRHVMTDLFALELNAIHQLDVFSLPLLAMTTQFAPPTHVTQPPDAFTHQSIAMITMFALQIHVTQLKDVNTHQQHVTDVLYSPIPNSPAVLPVLPAVYPKFAQSKTVKLHHVIQIQETVSTLTSLVPIQTYVKLSLAISTTEIANLQLSIVTTATHVPQTPAIHLSGAFVLP